MQALIDELKAFVAKWEATLTPTEETAVVDAAEAVDAVADTVAPEAPATN